MKIFFIVLVILGLGGLIYANTRNTLVPQGAEEQPVTQEPVTVKSEGKKMSFASFIEQGDGSYKCSVSQYLSDMDNKGTVYIDSGRIKGSFSTIAEGKTIDTSFVIRDGYSYAWSSAAPNFGVKSPVKKPMSEGSSADMSGSYSWNAEQIGEYDCQPWAPDDAMFVVPSNIKFTALPQ